MYIRGIINRLRPKAHPNAHTEEEIDLIMKMYKEHGEYGLAEVYVKSKEKGYDRCFQSMCKQKKKKKRGLERVIQTMRI